MPAEVIYCGDNAKVLPKHVADESVDLVYIDPPFNTGRNYEVFWGEAAEKRAFADRFGDPRAYVRWMEPRIREMYRVLKPSGSFYIHCDDHASHYLKVLLDDVFGVAGFRNHITWKRASAHSDGRQGARQFGRVCDTILFYSKGSANTWNTQHGAYDQTYIKRDYRRVDAGGRRYRLDNIQGPGGAAKGNPSYEVMGVTRYWRYSKERMEELIHQGRIVQTRPGAVPQYKRYLDEMPGVPLQDLWDDLPPINNRSKELIGYPTQKPVALLERIIKASSNPGDVVLDAFCGCGTSLEAAVRTGRRWIGIDMSPTACRVMARRLEERCGLVERRDFRLVDLPRTREELRTMPALEFQNWAVTALGGVPNRVKGADFGIDGRLYLADTAKPLSERRDLFGHIGAHWFPIQVKQKEKAGRPDIDAFETAMRRDKRTRGYFVSFDYTRDAHQEMRRALGDGLEIIAVTVDEILADEEQVYGTPPAELSVAQLRKQALPEPVAPVPQAVIERAGGGQATRARRVASG